MLGILEGLLKVLAEILKNPRVLILLPGLISLAGTGYALYFMKDISKSTLTSSSPAVIKYSNDINDSKVNDLFELIRKCNSETIGENCYLSFFEAAFFVHGDTGYTFKLEMLTRGKINENTNKYEEHRLFNYIKSRDPLPQYQNSYIIPAWLEANMLQQGRCSDFEVKKLPESHPFRKPLNELSIKAGRVSYCLGGCTVTLVQRAHHNAKLCITPACTTELANVYYKYFDKDKCYLDVTLSTS